MIQLNKDWRITTDPLNVILQKRVIVKKGDNAGSEYWTNAGYPSNYKDAIKLCVDRGIKEVSTLQGIANKVKELEDMINSLQGLDKINHLTSLLSESIDLLIEMYPYVHESDRKAYEGKINDIRRGFSGE